jgi:hypothetical protein
MITAKCLIEGQYASDTPMTVYTAPASTKTIIDKFTAFNANAGDLTITIYIVPSGGSASDANAILKTHTITTNTCFDSTELRNQILNAGDFIVVFASVASSISIRASGREVT